MEAAAFLFVVLLVVGGLVADHYQFGGSGAA